MKKQSSEVLIHIAASMGPHMLSLGEQEDRIHVPKYFALRL